MAKDGMQIDCRRCGQTAEPPDDVPYSGKDGDDIRRHACASCWEEWERSPLPLRFPGKRQSPR